MVPFGYTLETWADDSFTGDYEDVKGEVYADTDDSMNCKNLETNGNRVTSVAIYRNEYLSNATGRWVGVTASETFTFVYHVGFEYSESEATHEEQQTSLSYEMSYGMEFAGVSESTTISESYTETIAHDAEESYTYDVSVDLEFTCTGNDGVGLWQWVVDSADGKSGVLTGHTICRYGQDNYSKSPECPWNACLDVECTTCTGDWAA